MATRLVPHPVSHEMVEAEVVDIVEISERPTIITLVDGTVIRLKVDVVEVTRFEGEYDGEGNPLYNVKNGILLNILDAPEHLKSTEQ